MRCACRVERKFDVRDVFSMLETAHASMLLLFPAGVQQGAQPMQTQNAIMARAFRRQEPMLQTEPQLGGG